MDLRSPGLRMSGRERAWLSWEEASGFMELPEWMCVCACVHACVCGAAVLFITYVSIYLESDWNEGVSQRVPRRQLQSQPTGWPASSGSLDTSAPVLALPLAVMPLYLSP